MTEEFKEKLTYIISESPIENLLYTIKKVKKGLSKLEKMEWKIFLQRLDRDNEKLEDKYSAIISKCQTFIEAPDNCCKEFLLMMDAKSIMRLLFTC